MYSQTVWTGGWWRDCHFTNQRIRMSSGHTVNWGMILEMPKNQSAINSKAMRQFL